MITMKIGGREFALLFNVEAMDELEAILGISIDLTNLQEALIGRLRDRHDLVHVFYVLARQGEYETGREPDFDEQWLRRRMRPGSQLQVHAKVVEAIADGLKMESETEKDEEVDVVLAELKKKRTE